MRDRLAHADVVESSIRLLGVEADEEVRQAREADRDEIAVGLEPLDVLSRRVLDHVDGAALDLVGPLPRLEDGNPLDGVEVGGTGVRDVRDVRAWVGIPAVHHDLGAGLEARQRERPRPVRLGRAVVLAELRALREVLDHRVLGRERLRERRERRAHGADHRRRVGSLHVGDRGPEDRVLSWPAGVAGGIPERVEVVGDHLRVERRAGLERQPLADHERPGEQVLRDLPRIDEPRLVATLRIADDRELVQRHVGRIGPVGLDRVHPREVAVVPLDELPAGYRLAGRLLGRRLFGRGRVGRRRLGRGLPLRGRSGGLLVVSATGGEQRARDRDGDAEGGRALEEIAPRDLARGVVVDQLLDRVLLRSGIVPIPHPNPSSSVSCYGSISLDARTRANG